MAFWNEFWFKRTLIRCGTLYYFIRRKQATSNYYLVDDFQKICIDNYTNKEELKIILTKTQKIKKRLGRKLFYYTRKFANS